MKVSHRNEKKLFFFYPHFTVLSENCHISTALRYALLPVKHLTREICIPREKVGGGGASVSKPTDYPLTEQ